MKGQSIFDMAAPMVARELQTLHTYLESRKDNGKRRRGDANMSTREFRPWMKPLPDGEGFFWICAICQIPLHRKEIHQDWDDKDKPGVIICPGCYFGRRIAKGSIDSQNKGLRDEVVRLRFILKGFVDALPTKRDWLDPVLEREAKAALTPQGGKGGVRG